MDFLRPDASYPNLASVPWSAYREHFDYLFLDADNTLQVHGRTEASPAAKAMVDTLQSLGFKVILYSNASPERAKGLAQSLDIELLAKANKPSPKALNEFIKEKAWDPDRVLVVGDQLFTDLWAGQRAKVKTLHVKPISKDEAWWIKPKRWLEHCFIKKWGETDGFDDLLS